MPGIAGATESTNERLYVLMESYGKIKEEIDLNIRRYDTILSLMPSIALALLITLRQYSVTMVFPFVPYLFLGITAMYLQSRLNITFLSRYMVYLEGEINGLIGEETLIWETKWVDLGLFYNRYTVFNGFIAPLIIAALFVYSIWVGFPEALHKSTALGVLLLISYILLLALILICYYVGYKKLLAYGDRKVLFNEIRRREEEAEKERVPWYKRLFRYKTPPVDSL